MTASTDGATAGRCPTVEHEVFAICGFAFCPQCGLSIAADARAVDPQTCPLPHRRPPSRPGSGEQSHRFCYLCGSALAALDAPSPPEQRHPLQPLQPLPPPLPPALPPPPLAEATATAGPNANAILSAIATNPLSSPEQPVTAAGETAARPSFAPPAATDSSAVLGAVPQPPPAAPAAAAAAAAAAQGVPPTESPSEGAAKEAVASPADHPADSPQQQQHQQQQQRTPPEATASPPVLSEEDKAVVDAVLDRLVRQAASNGNTVSSPCGLPDCFLCRRQPQGRNGGVHCHRQPQGPLNGAWTGNAIVAIVHNHYH